MQSIKTTFAGIVKYMYIQVERIGYSVDQHCCSDYQDFLLLHVGVNTDHENVPGPVRKKQRTNKNISMSQLRGNSWPLITLSEVV